MTIGRAFPDLLTPLSSAASVEEGLAQTLDRLVERTGAAAGALVFTPPHEAPIVVTAGGRRLPPELGAWLRAEVQTPAGGWRPARCAAPRWPGRGADTCRRVAARARRAARLAARSRGRAEDAARGVGAARRRVAAPGACAHALHPGVRLPARARRGPRPRLAPPSTQAPHVGAKRAHAAPRLDPLARGRVPRVRRGRGEARGVRLGRGVAAGLGARRV